MNPTLDLLNSHRTIRRFEDRALPDGLLEKLVDAGRRASTSSNLQAYSVIHVAEPERKKQIAALCADQVQVHQSAAFLVFCADLHRNRLAFGMHDGERFAVGALEGRALHTPGHTPNCMVYVIGDAAFVGDTLFMPDYGTARCDFPGGDARTLYRSIQKILSLPEDTRLFMCHDYKAPGRDGYAWESSAGLRC